MRNYTRRGIERKGFHRGEEITINYTREPTPPVEKLCATCHKPLGHSDKAMGCIRCKPCRVKRPGKLEGISRRTPKPKVPVTDRYPERTDQPSPPRVSWWMEEGFRDRAAFHAEIQRKYSN